jgi:putative nucleotidyltransferase with HDIG domain
VPGEGGTGKGQGVDTQGLRPLLRAYLFAVTGIAAFFLIASAELPDFAQLARAFLFAGVAAVAQLRPIHISQNIKATAEDAATFAAALTLGPFLSALVAASSTIVALRTSPGERFGLRVFNSATSALGTGGAALVFGALAEGGAIAEYPFAVAAAAITKYAVETAVVDGAVALQLRRNPVATWWPIHRRDILPHVGLYFLGLVAALLTATAPWAILIFVVPAALLLLTLQESTRLRERTRRAVLDLADIVDARDPYTRGHSQRTADLAERLARRLSLDPGQVELVRLAARVHDIGKVGTDDHVLLKPGPLDQFEMMEMQRHAEIGATLLAQFPEFWEGANIVLAHHERPDGKGYPRGLHAADLPFEAAVVAVADAYDAMTNDRPYRKAMPWSEARAQLQRYRGLQWDARVVDTFVELIDEDQRTVPSPEPAAAPLVQLK